jgi:hypothetical protein
MTQQVDIDDVIIGYEKQLTDLKRIISHATESKIDLERKIERLYALRDQD